MKKNKEIYNMAVWLNEPVVELNKRFESYKQDGKNSKLIIQLSVKDVLNQPQQLLQFITNLSLTYNVNPTNCTFYINVDGMGLIPKKHLNKVLAFNELLNKKYKNNLMVKDCDTLFSLNDVKKASEEIYAIRKFCAQKKLSPAEALLYCYLTVIQKKYKTELPEETSGVSRSIYGVLSSDKIVCVGYIELMINYLDYKNILTFSNRTKKILQDGTAIGHRTMLVYIKDKKYNIDGYYFLDPTKDKRINKEKISVRLNNFLVPLGDIVNSKSQYLDFKTMGKPKLEQTYNRLGYYFKSFDDKISFGQNGLSFCSQNSFEWFCDVNEKSNPNFAALKQLLQEKDGLNIDEETMSHKEIEDFILNNSTPIQYLTMQKLIYNVFNKITGIKKDGESWKTTNAVMEYNTQISTKYYKLNDSVKNVFALQKHLNESHVQQSNNK